GFRRRAAPTSPGRARRSSACARSCAICSTLRGPRAASARRSTSRRWAGVSFRVIVEGEAPPALADRSSVAQLLLNLVLNAGDAVRPQRGNVRVCLAPAALERRTNDDTGSAAGRRRTDAVELRVEDDGPGIPEADRERIFDPFFTTKDPGEGTGLGLAHALRSAGQSGGRLDLAEQRPGVGAVFVLTLPVAAQRSG